MERAAPAQQPAVRARSRRERGGRRAVVVTSMSFLKLLSLELITPICCASRGSRRTVLSAPGINGDPRGRLVGRVEHRHSVGASVCQRVD